MTRLLLKSKARAVFSNSTTHFFIMAKDIKIAYLHGKELLPSISDRLIALKNELTRLLKQDERRDIMYAELHEISNDIHEFVAAVDQWHDYDPTPQFLYDNDGGEPAVSAAERDAATFAQKRELHS